MASLGHNELNTFSSSENQCNLNHIWLKFVHVSLTYNTSAMVLVMTWQQVITWTNVGWVLWCHSASLGPSELEISNHGKSLDTSAFTKLWNLPWRVTEVQFHCNGLHSSDHIGQKPAYLWTGKSKLFHDICPCAHIIKLQKSFCPLNATCNYQKSHQRSVQWHSIPLMLAVTSGDGWR